MCHLKGESKSPGEWIVGSITKSIGKTYWKDLFNYSTRKAQYEVGNRIQNWIVNREPRNDEHGMTSEVGGIRNKKMKHLAKTREIEKIHKKIRIKQ